MFEDIKDKFNEFQLLDPAIALLWALSLAITKPIVSVVKSTFASLHLGLAFQLCNENGKVGKIFVLKWLLVTYAELRLYLTSIAMHDLDRIKTVLNIFSLKELMPILINSEKKSPCPSKKNLLKKSLPLLNLRTIIHDLGSFSIWSF